PKPSAYRLANLVGLAMGLLGVFVAGIVALPSPRSGSNPGLAVVVGLFMAGFAFLGWFTSRPPTITATRERLAVLGGAPRRREDRSRVIGIYRGVAPSRSRPDRSVFVVLTTARAIIIPIRHFNPAGLEEAMRRLGVPIRGDYTQLTDEIEVKARFSREAA